MALVYINNVGFKHVGKILFPRVWPIKTSPLSWPPVRPIDDFEAHSIAGAIIEHARKQPPAVIPS
jgi:hypothetical protein